MTRMKLAEVSRKAAKQVELHWQCHGKYFSFPKAPKTTGLYYYRNYTEKG